MSNCTGSSNDYAIYLSESTYNNITDCTTSSNNYGIYLINSNYNNITKCNASSNKSGIRLIISDYNSVTNSNVTSNDFGIYLSNSDSNNVADCNASSNVNSGIHIRNSDYNNITDCIGNSNDVGVYLVDNADFNNIINCDTSYNAARGIYIYDSSYNNITNCTESSNGDDGIYLYHTGHTNIINCNTSYNAARGMYISNSDYNNITNCTVSSNNYGIYFKVSDLNTVILSNMLDNNYGVYLTDSHGLVIGNSTVASSVSYDFSLDDSSTTTAINVTFDYDAVDSLTGSTLVVRNYLRINVLDIYDNPIEDADVEVKDNKQVIYASPGYGGSHPKTNGYGLIPWILVTDGIFSGLISENKTYVNVSFSPKYFSYMPKEVNMSTTHTEKIKEGKRTPDLTLGSTDIFFSVEEILIGDTVTIYAEVRNIGLANATNAIINFYNDGNLIGNDKIDVLAEKTGNASVQWKVPSIPGTHSICIRIDEKDNIIEENETNNHACIYITVRGADLTLEPIDISFSGENIIIEDTVTIYAEIHNIGLANTTNVLINFYAGEDIIGNDTIDVLAERTENASLQWEVPSIVGTHSICVKIDEGDTIVELNETNNYACISINIRGADLTLGSGDISFSGENIIIEDTVTIYAEIHNIGLGNATNVIVSFYDGEDFIGNDTIDVLVEETGNASVQWEVTSQPGTHAIYVRIDEGDNIIEENETNNVASCMIVVKTRPDLVLTKNDITFSDENPVENQIIIINATIHNIGETDGCADIQFFSTCLDFFSLNESTCIGSVSLSVAGNSNDKASIIWNGTVGLHTVVVAIIDCHPYEMNLLNNVANKTINISVQSEERQVDEKETPATVAAIGAIIVLSLLGTFIAGTEVGKYKFLNMFFLPLYTRIARENVLDNKNRFMVYGYISANPGTHYNAIKKVLDLNTGTLLYHLKVLERERFIKSKNDRTKKRFHPIGRKNTTAQRLLDIITVRPGITQKELKVLTKLKQQTISYNLKFMVEDELLRAEKIQGKKHYYFVEPEVEKSPFKNCPYCGKHFTLEKTPNYCPYCSESLR